MRMSKDVGKVGRPKRLSYQELEMAVRLYFEEGLSVRDVADVLNVSHMTVWRALNKLSLS
jgi:predicted DNA-binding protein (UPF0251 family)